MPDSTFEVKGGSNQILPNATEAKQHVDITIFNGNQPSEKHAHVGKTSEATLDGEYHCFVTHDAVDVPSLINHARHQIVLHAAYYPKYGVDDQGEYILQAMRQNPKLHLTAIFTDPESPWLEEFSHTLRTHFTEDLFVTQLEASKQLFIHCQKEFGSKRVRVCDTSLLPMMPLIMIDDTLIIGHYAHSQIKPPHGLWFTIKHPKILSMYMTLLAGGIPDCNTVEERAILRYVEELMID